MNKQFLAALIITLSVSVSFAAGPAREAPKAKEDPRKEQGRKKTKAMTPAEAAKAIEMERATKEADKGNSARPNRVKEGFAPEGKNAPETIGKHDARGAKQVTGEFNNGRPVTTEDVTRCAGRSHRGEPAHLPGRFLHEKLRNASDRRSLPQSRFGSLCGGTSGHPG
ncbi:MAG: hypothetical protein HYR96_03905 [Deltaproteobacteria bacterium]|nr:hypothetical protein [Deltaproteobacteria bacterium]